MTRLKILVMDEDDCTGEVTFECDVHDLPAPFDEVVDAYDAMDSPAFEKVMLDWPLIHLWPHVKEHARDGEVDILVTFLDHDPGGLCEMEFLLQDGELI